MCEIVLKCGRIWPKNCNKICESWALLHSILRWREVLAELSILSNLRLCPYKTLDTPKLWVALRTLLCWTKRFLLGQSRNSTTLLALAKVPLLIGAEQDLVMVDLLTPGDTLCLHIERGDFPYSFVQYKSNSQPLTHWSKWVIEILTNQTFSTRLHTMGLYDAVVISQKLTLNHSTKNLYGLVDCWNHVTHTFVRDGESLPLP